jgi:guanylate kinase
MSARAHPTSPVVLSAPSGAGKTTIAKALVDSREDVVFSVSATTRPSRDNELDGVDYHFLSLPDFRAMIKADEFVEWAEVHGYLYGTLRKGLQDAQDQGRFLVLDVDVQGAMQVRQRVPDAVLVFVLPPSADALVERLTGRGTEEEDTLTRRIENARDELEQASQFDYIVVNENLDQAIEEVQSILLAHGRRTDRAIDLSHVIRQLQRRIDEILAGDFDSTRK